MTSYEWKLYFPREHLIGVLKWWESLKSSGELEKVFHSSLHSLSDFIAHFQKIPLLWTTRNGSEFEGCVWWDLLADKPCVGVWVRTRHLPGLMRSVIKLLRELATVFGGILLMTTQSEVEVLCGKLGAEKVGVIPKLSDQHDVSVYFLPRP